MGKKTPMMDPEQWPELKDLPDEDRRRIEWLLRFPEENGIVKCGCAVKFGKRWRVNRALWPEFLARETARVMDRKRLASPTKRHPKNAVERPSP
jgi:hypothetical protein